MYQGVKFIPKVVSKYQFSSSESDKLEELIKQRPISLAKQQSLVDKAQCRPISTKGQPKCNISQITNTTTNISAAYGKKKE